MHGTRKAWCEMDNTEYEQLELDAIGEISNICLGNGATSLGILTRETIDITPPDVKVLNRGDVIGENQEKMVIVKVAYVVGIDGCSILILKENDAKMIADMMMGGDGHGMFFDMEISEMHLSATSEAMNQMMGASATSLSKMINRKTDISTPETEYMDKGTFIKHEFPNDDRFVEIFFRMNVGNKMEIPMYQLYPYGVAKAISDLYLLEKGISE